MTWAFLEEDNSTILLNGSDTLVKKSKRVSDSFVMNLFSDLDECIFPIEYTRGLSEIYFTVLKGADGDYRDGKIRISCNNKLRAKDVLIHEIGHHIDSQFELSTEPCIVDEWYVMSSSFYHRTIHKDVGEYLAIGFENYYNPVAGGTAIFKLRHPVLWHCINELHKRIV